MNGSHVKQQESAGNWGPGDTGARNEKWFLLVEPYPLSRNRKLIMEISSLITILDGAPSHWAVPNMIGKVCLSLLLAGTITPRIVF